MTEREGRWKEESWGEESVSQGERQGSRSNNNYDNSIAADRWTESKAFQFEAIEETAAVEEETAAVEEEADIVQEAVAAVQGVAIMKAEVKIVPICSQTGASSHPFGFIISPKLH